MQLLSHNGLPMFVSSHRNVWNTCLRILKNRGYTLSVEGEMTEDGCYPSEAWWIATNTDHKFGAHNPIELLGLLAVHDHIQPTEDVPYWWSIDGPDLWLELMEAAFPDDPSID